MVETSLRLLRLFILIWVQLVCAKLDRFDWLVLEFHFSFQSRIEAVFYVIVCSSRQELGYFAPLVSVLLMSQYDGTILLGSPFVLFDVWIKMVVPAFTTLLTDSARECLCDVTPVFCAKFFYVKCKSVVFLLTPRSFDHRGVEHFLPSVQALDVCPLI